MKVTLCFAIIFVICVSNFSFAVGQMEEYDKRVNTLEKQVIKLEQEIKDSKSSSWELQIAILALVVAFAGVFLSSYFNNKSNNLSKDSFNSFKKVSEAEFLLKLDEMIYRSDEGKKIIECAKHNTKVLKSNGGEVSERELENFLNEIENVWTLIKQGVITSELAEIGFSWVIERIHEHKEIMTYIATAQKKYGDIAWKPITDYKPKNKSESNTSRTAI